MAKDADNLADRFESENTGGLLSGFLAEEDEFDRRALWRLGSWAVGTIAAITIAFFANQSSIGWRRDQIAAADLARQAQQIQTVAKESQSEARRLASAIDTLNGDRDRLYSRVNVLEQGMDSVTGAISRQSAASGSPQGSAQGSSQGSSQAGATPAVSAPMVVAALTEVQKLPIGPPVAPVATTAPAMAAIPIPAKPVATAATATPPADKPSTVATVTDPAPAATPSTAQAPSTQTPSNPPTATVPPPLMESKSMMGPPDPAAGKLIEPPTALSSPSTSPKTAAAPPAQAPQKPEAVASAPPAAADDGPEATESIPKIQRTEFGVDVGGANSVGGLRALWRGLLKTRANAPLAALRPIIVIKESSTGLGMQLRLVAGPLTDAAAAAKICASMSANDRPCETTVFDGQRLSLTGNDHDQPAPTTPTTTTKPAHSRHGSYRHSAAPKEEPAPKPAPSTLSLIFGR